MGGIGWGKDVADMILLDVTISVFEDNRSRQGDVFFILTGLDVWWCSLLETPCTMRFL